MSDFKVTVTKILKLEPIPKADKLELAHVYGWVCVVPKGRYEVGSQCVYIPIDSVLPEELEAVIFEGAKVKLHNHKVKTIKLRGAISQGLVVAPDLILKHLKWEGEELIDEMDLAETLGIHKYEPPAPAFQSVSHPAKLSYKNPNFKVYFKFANHKYYPDLFKPEDDVVITEKIHGTNFRAGWVPFHANTLWRRFLKFIGMAPQYQFVYGSHNVQVSEKMLYNGYYDKNVYAEAVVKYDLKKKIPHGKVIYGEIYGEGIQKDYDYGVKSERRLIVFDIMDSDTGHYLSYGDARHIIEHLELDHVPLLYIGKMSEAGDLKQYIEGSSALAPEQKVREGCIIRSLQEEHCIAGRKMLKCINPEYLLGDQTEFH